MNNNYLEQLEQFADYIDACRKVFVDFGDDGEEFFEIEFELKFRNQSVKIANCDETFNAIMRILCDEIEFQKENF